MNLNFPRLSFGWRFPSPIWEDVDRVHAVKLLGSFLSSTMVKENFHCKFQMGFQMLCLFFRLPL